MAKILKSLFQSKLRFARISPRKVRLIADLIRGKRVDLAFAILRNNARRGAAFIDKALRAAWASAELGDVTAEESRYFVSKAMVDGGPIIYRGRPASMGRFVRIRKRTSHILVEICAKKEEPDSESEGKEAS